MQPHDYNSEWKAVAAKWAEISTKKQQETLELQAETKTLPDFLMIEDIAYLLGRTPHVFREFIEGQPVKIEMALGVPCISRDSFKEYRQSINQWPVKGSLANWWPEEPENTCIQTETNKTPAYLDKNHPMYSQELAIAIECWNQVFAGNPPKPKQGSRKALAVNWLNEHHRDFPKEAKNRIATMLNPDKNGGAPSS